MVIIFIILFQPNQPGFYPKEHVENVPRPLEDLAAVIKFFVLLCLYDYEY